MSYQDALARVVSEVIAPAAADVDSGPASFPAARSRRSARRDC